MRSVALKSALERIAPGRSVEPRRKGAPVASDAPAAERSEDLFAELRRDVAQEPKGYVLRWEVRGGGE